MKLNALGLAVSLAMGLAACNDSSTDSNNYDFQVTAIDGYLKNAVVTTQCGDKTFTANATDASGKTNVDTDGIPSSQCSVTITAKADGSTQDVETGKNFAAGELFLKAPAGLSGDLVATPFTTLVAMLLDAGEVTDLNQAVQEVATQYGIPPSLVTGDFVASSTAEAREVALKAIALVPFLPKTKAAFEQLVSDDNQLADLSSRLEQVNTEVEARIEQLKSEGKDLREVFIEVVPGENGSFTLNVKGVVEEPAPTGGTGGTGTGGTAVGGGTGA